MWSTLIQHVSQELDTSASFIKIKLNVLWILWSRFLFCIMKITNFQGDLTDILAKKEALLDTELEAGYLTPTFCRSGVPLPCLCHHKWVATLSEVLSKTASLLAKCPSSFTYSQNRVYTSSAAPTIEGRSVRSLLWSHQWGSYHLLSGLCRRGVEVLTRLIFLGFSWEGVFSIQENDVCGANRTRVARTSPEVYIFSTGTNHLRPIWHKFKSYNLTHFARKVPVRRARRRGKLGPACASGQACLLCYECPHVWLDGACMQPHVLVCA